MFTFRCWSLAVLFVFNSILLHSTDGVVEISAVPATIDEGLTKHLVINCTETNKELKSYDILSLAIKRSKDATGNNFEDIAIVTQYSSSHVATLIPIKAMVSGNIDHQGISYLALEFDNPASTEAGHYVCEANLLDKVGQADAAYASANVTSRTSFSQQTQLNTQQIKVLFDRIDNLEKILRANITELSHVITSNSGNNGSSSGSGSGNQLEIDDLKLKYGALKSDVDNIQSNITDNQNQLMRYKTLMFEESDEYNGHKYLLSTFQYLSLGFSEVMCEMFGGYLVEIETQDEYDFILTFVKPRVRNILIGMTDVEKDNEWKYVQSGRVVTFFKWSQWGEEEGEGSSSNCAYLDENWEMGRHACSGRRSTTFLCEINE